MRNGIVAAYCDVLIVVESARSGGSLITADFANQYHKDVFAVPGRTTDPLSAGTNFLIKTHQAALLENAGDIAYVLGWDNPSIPEKQLRLFENLDKTELALVEMLRTSDGMDFDQLALHLKLPPNHLSTLVLQLEFKGIVKSAPGNRLLLV